jgi:hypothetical protein
MFVDSKCLHNIRRVLCIEWNFRTANPSFIPSILFQLQLLQALSLIIIKVKVEAARTICYSYEGKPSMCYRESSLSFTSLCHHKVQTMLSWSWGKQSLRLKRIHVGYSWYNYCWQSSCTSRWTLPFHQSLKAINVLQVEYWVSMNF